MKVRIDVYSQDIDAALAVFKKAAESGIDDATLRSENKYESDEFHYVNLMFDADHKSKILSELDDGPFVTDTDDFEDDEN
jgi:hypothetical protein